MSCQHLVLSLKECLLFSDCVVKHGHLPSECLKEHVETLPTECQGLRMAVFECKRAQLDMRKRFRGVPGRKLPNDIPAIPPLLDKPEEQDK